MFLSNRVKLFLTLTFFIVFTGACGYGPSVTGNSASQIDRIVSELPFSTREPEIYSADVVVTTGSYHRKIRTARSGNKRRYDFDVGEKKQISVIRSDKYVRIFPARKIYCEDAGNTVLTDIQDDPLTLGLLHRATFGEFQEIGSDSNLIRYEAKQENAGLTRTVIFVDKKIGLPIKQEFYSLEGDDEVLQYTMELLNLEPSVDEAVFRVPQDYRKVSTDEFNRFLRQE